MFPMLWRRASLPCAAGLSICFRWAAKCLTASIYSTMKSTASKPLTRTHSALSPPFPKSACCRRTNSPPTARRKKSSAAASARKSMAIRTMPLCTKPSATATSAQAWNIICRCFLKTSWKRCLTISAKMRCLTISAKMRCLSLWATFTPRQTAFGAMSNHVMPWHRAMKPIHLCFHSICISLPMFLQAV